MNIDQIVEYVADALIMRNQIAPKNEVSKMTTLQTTLVENGYFAIAADHVILDDLLDEIDENIADYYQAMGY